MGFRGTALRPGRTLPGDISLQQVFSTSAPLAFSSPVLYTVPVHLAASLACDHWMLVPLHDHDNQNHLQTLPTGPWVAGRGHNLPSPL